MPLIGNLRPNLRRTWKLCLILCHNLTFPPMRNFTIFWVDATSCHSNDLNGAEGCDVGLKLVSG